MKKILFAAVAALLLSACAEEDPAKGVVVEKVFTSTSTIKGVAYLNVNTSGTTLEQFVPAGTQLVFTVANKDYGIKGAGGGAAQGNFVKTATVGGNGTYEVALPAREDGEPVTVKITSDPVLVNINLNGIEEKKIFTIETNQSQAIVKGLTYQKKLTYEAKDNLSESANWKDGTYTTILKYNNGKEDVFVPEGTEVKVTVSGNSFIPKRTNDLVIIVKVKAGGVLEIKMPAKSLLDGGLSFNMTSSFIAGFITVTSGVENTSKYIFEMNSTAGIVYGGEVNNTAAIKFTKGAKVEQTDILSTWKNATFAVKYLYSNDHFDHSKNYIAIPGDAKVTITEKRSSVDASLSDVVKVMTYDQFIGSTYQTLAPDPAVSDDVLSITIKVDFITTCKTGENSGSAINNTFKYSYTSGSFALLGGISTNGGTNFLQPDHTTEVKNAVYLDAATYATKLTNN